jgi:hypothetical protein
MPPAGTAVALDSPSPITGEGSLTERMQTSWDRLQSLLESLVPGEEVHLAAASRQTGLSPTTCETVLDHLSRIALFTRVGDHTFVRTRMDDAQAAGGAADTAVPNRARS